MTRRLRARLAQGLPRLADLYRRLRDARLMTRAPVTTPWGFRMVGNEFMASGRFEPEETALVRSLLADADVLVNVGANIGYYCCHALSLGKSVIAFEPMQRNLHFLYRNVRLNGWTDIEILPVALSDRCGVLEIYGSDTGASLLKGWAGTPENHVTLVPCSTADTLLGSRLAGRRVLVLVDIEGAEPWMLKGATALLRNDPQPTWLIEIMQDDRHATAAAPFEESFARFFGAGYRAFAADQRTAEVTPDQVAAAAHGGPRLGTHNFVFMPSAAARRKPIAA